MRNALAGSAPWHLPSVAASPSTAASLKENYYGVRLARDERDLEAAQRLRFEVFHRELKLGLAGSFTAGLDQDAFDRYCDHLNVIDLRDDRVVGTYRLLPSDRVPSFGYHSETEFHLENVKRAGGRLLELGRSCVAPDYLSGRVIQMFFQGIAAYAGAREFDTLMGCASIRGNDIDELREIFSYLKRSHLSDRAFHVSPKRGFELPGIETPVEFNETEILQSLPPLFRGYLRLGAKICGPPAFDRQFGTADFFLSLPAREVAERYDRRFSPRECVA
jgi:L-ornithine Nalpha-acyltransferase